MAKTSSTGTPHTATWSAITYAIVAGVSTTTNSRRYGSAGRDTGRFPPDGAASMPNVAGRSTGRNSGAASAQSSGRPGECTPPWTSRSIRDLRYSSSSPWHSR